MLIYKLSAADGQFQGHIWLIFMGQRLHQVHYELAAPLSEAQWRYWNAIIPQTLQGMEALKAAKLQPVLLNELKRHTVREKIVMFAAWHKQHRGVNYIAKQLEKANLAHVPMSPKLLDTFFRSPLQNFTLKNYIDRINITRDMAENGTKTRHPGHFDPAYDRSLSPEQRNDYYAHLRSLGWVSTYNPNSGTIWKEKERG